MAASGFTPIQLYHSTTASNIPLAANLANGEVGLNIADMKLYAKNSSGVVTLLASNSGAVATVSSVAVSGGTTGLTTSGGPITTTGTITFAGTLVAANGGTGFSSYTTGDMLFASGATAISKLSLGTTNFVLTAGASAPQYVAQSTLAVGTATNLAGGTVGASPYQTGSGATTFLSLGTAGHVLTAGASAPQYVAQSTLSVGTATNIANGVANQVVYQSGAGSTAFVSAPTTGGTVLGWTGSAFAWVSAPAATVATNLAGGSAGVVPYQSGASTTSFTGVGTAGQSLISNGTSAPAFATLNVIGGGTGITTYTTGDILFASSSSALSNLADVATGNALISGGVGVAPSYGKIGLTTHVSGTLPIANGGTGQTTATAAFDALAPSQGGNSGKYLTTNGTTTSWGTVDALPSQTGNAGKYLSTNGTVASWQETGASAAGVIWENSLIVASNYTLTANKNGMSVGPITINSGVVVTVPSGQRWVIL
jgi:hypothetical protein